MATQLPTLSVNDAQLAALMEVFGDAPGYKAELKAWLILRLKQHKQEEIHAIYLQRVAELQQQEVDALLAVDAMLSNLSTG